MVLDYARQAYRSRMRLWQNDPETVEGVWFRAPEGAGFFPRPHPWASTRTWYRHQYVEDDQVGEVERIEYYKGANPASYRGVNHCGSDDAMSMGGVHGIDPPILTSDTGRAACCAGETISVCGLEIPKVFRLKWSSPAGCVCASGTEFTMSHGAESATFHVWYSDLLPGGEQAWRNWGTCSKDGRPLQAKATMMFLKDPTCDWGTTAITLVYADDHTFAGSVADSTFRLQGGWPPPLSVDTIDNVDAWAAFPGGFIVSAGTCVAKLSDPTKRAKLEVLP